MARRARRSPSKRGTAARASSGPELLLRGATPADLALLVRHRRRMWREIGRWSEADLDRADRAYRSWVLRERRAKRFFAFIVETRQGVPAGSGAVWLAPNQPRPGRVGTLELPYILSMFTEPRFRRRGVATRLVLTMIDWAEGRGYGRVVLHASVKGRPVYARLGFEPSREMRLDLPARRG